MDYNRVNKQYVLELRELTKDEWKSKEINGMISTLFLIFQIL